MNGLLKLVWFFFEICLFKRAPQDIPAATSLFALLFVTYNVISSFAAMELAAIQEIDGGHAALVAVIESFIFVGVFAGMLYIAKFPERILQTLTALLGISIILELIGLPMIFMLMQYENPQDIPVLLSFFLTAFIFWHFLVYGHIVRHALDTTFGLGVLFSFVNMLIVAFILMPILPKPPATA